MSPRPRSVGNIDLPLFVESTKQRNGRVIFRYKLPSGQYASLGSDRENAIAAGKALNSELIRNPDLVARILQAKKDTDLKVNKIPPMKFAIERFKTHLNKKNLAISTRKEQDLKLANYDNAWGTKQPDEVTILDIAGFLEEKTNNAYVKHRILLIELWTYLTHQGWASENIPNKTMLGITLAKKRKRHTSEALDEIVRISPDWLQRAINLARHSVQRRGDLVLLHKDMVNLSANTITVLQAKTQNYTMPVYMEIDMHAELRKAVIDCLSDRLAFICPYLLHYRPERVTEKAKAAKVHHLAMTDDHLTKSFAKYRDESGVYAHLTAEEKPSFHDVRALGMFELGKKYSKEYASALAGHASMKMTEHYLEGHEPVKPVYVSFVKSRAE